MASPAGIAAQPMPLTIDSESNHGVPKCWRLRDMEQIGELILKIAQTLVDHPEQVSLEVKESETTMIFELSVAVVDLGKIIGKHGRIADAIRTIVGSVSGKARKKRFMLEIIQ
jgi:uncharacterized protein